MRVVFVSLVLSFLGAVNFVDAQQLVLPNTIEANIWGFVAPDASIFAPGNYVACGQISPFNQNITTKALVFNLRGRCVELEGLSSINIGNPHHDNITNEMVLRCEIEDHSGYSNNLAGYINGSPRSLHNLSIIDYNLADTTIRTDGHGRVRAILLNGDTALFTITRESYYEPSLNGIVVLNGIQVEQGNESNHLSFREILGEYVPSFPGLILDPSVPFGSVLDDWHINSIDYTVIGGWDVLVLSAREPSLVILVYLSPQGFVEYSLKIGRDTDFTLNSGNWWAYQHDVNVLNNYQGYESNESTLVLALFDNGIGFPDGPQGNALSSTFKVCAVDLVNMTVDVIEERPINEPNVTSIAMGSQGIMDNGDLIIGKGFPVSDVSILPPQPEPGFGSYITSTGKIDFSFLNPGIVSYAFELFSLPDSIFPELICTASTDYIRVSLKENTNTRDYLRWSHDPLENGETIELPLTWNQDISITETINNIGFGITGHYTSEPLHVSQEACSIVTGVAQLENQVKEYYAFNKNGVLETNIDQGFIFDETGRKICSFRGRGMSLNHLSAGLYVCTDVNHSTKRTFVVAK